MNEKRSVEIQIKKWSKEYLVIAKRTFCNSFCLCESAFHEYSWASVSRGSIWLLSSEWGLKEETNQRSLKLSFAVSLSFTGNWCLGPFKQILKPIQISYGPVSLLGFWIWVGYIRTQLENFNYRNLNFDTRLVSISRLLSGFLSVDTQITRID